MASPVDISVFGFPFATRYSLDIHVHLVGARDIWNEAYSEVDNVIWPLPSLGSAACIYRR